MMKLYWAILEDGSLSIEWIGDGLRFGLSLEADLEESSWRYVTRNEIEGGTIPDELLQEIVRRITESGINKDD